MAQLREDILHKDDDILVLNKPAGLAVQGGSRTPLHIDAALPALKFGADDPPRLVHRLDRDTSGVLVLARHRHAARFITRQFAARKVAKLYWALVFGVPRPTRGTIELALAKRAGADGKAQMRPAPRDGKPARTDYAVLARAGKNFSWVAFRPLTGRTHQIRAHAAAIGYPLVGDGKYRGPRAETEFGGIIDPKLHLHARSLEMPHPAGEMFAIHAPLRDHMARSWETLSFDVADAPDDPFDEE